MAAMMLLMVVLLIAPGAGGHMRLHSANEVPAQPAQSHEHEAANAAPSKPEVPPGVPIEADQP